MNIVKRLMNVVTIAAIVAFLYGAVQIIFYSLADSSRRATHCENEEFLNRIQDRRLRQRGVFVPSHLEIDARSENIANSIALYSELCRAPRPISSMVSPAKTMGLTFLALLLFGVISNYILFGNITLWNKAEYPRKE